MVIDADSGMTFAYVMNEMCGGGIDAALAQRGRDREGLSHEQHHAPLSCPSVRFNARVGTGTEDPRRWINGDGRVRT